MATPKNPKLFSEPWILYPLIRMLILLCCLFVSGVFLFTFFTGSAAPALAPWYGAMQIVLIFIDLVLVFVTVFAAVELFHYRPKFVFDPRKPARRRAAKSRPANLRESWAKLRTTLESGSPGNIRAAILEANKLVDGVLESKGYEGDTFADRLDKLDSANFQTLDRAWSAHRLRNDLVHTPGFEASLEQGRQALQDYEAFLKELGAL